MNKLCGTAYLLRNEVENLHRLNMILMRIKPVLHTGQQNY